MSHNALINKMSNSVITSDLKYIKSLDQVEKLYKYELLFPTEQLEKKIARIFGRDIELFNTVLYMLLDVDVNKNILEYIKRNVESKHRACLKYVHVSTRDYDALVNNQITTNMDIIYHAIYARKPVESILDVIRNTDIVWTMTHILELYLHLDIMFLYWIYKNKPVTPTEDPYTTLASFNFPESSRVFDIETILGKDSGHVCLELKLITAKYAVQNGYPEMLFHPSTLDGIDIKRFWTCFKNDYMTVTEAEMCFNLNELYKKLHTLN